MFIYLFCIDQNVNLIINCELLKPQDIRASITSMFFLALNRLQVLEFTEHFIPQFTGRHSRMAEQY